MTSRRASRTVAALAAVLLCSGVLAARPAWLHAMVGAVERPTDGAPDGPVGAAGLSQSALVDDEAHEGSPEATVVVAPPAPPSLPASAPAVGTGPTTTRPATRPAQPGASTTPTLPPGVPLPAFPPVTGIPNIAPASSWSDEREGVRARMRIEPAAPVAGQAVRFIIDVSSAEPCCTILLSFGDGSPGFSVNNGARCGSLTPGARNEVTSHVFASAGAYKASLVVFAGAAGASCSPSPLSPGTAPSLPFTASVAVTGCIGVGPGSAGQAGCSPFPTFGPDSIVSPVLDPFCQVRSDCTKASPPR